MYVAYYMTLSYKAKISYLNKESLFVFTMCMDFVMNHYGSHTLSQRYP